MSVAIHSPTTIYSPRHAPSWLLLSLAAGAVNAGALLACQRFVSHVSGTATTLGVNAGQWWSMFDYLIILVCFVAGAMASVLAIGARHHRGLPPRYALPMLTVAGLIVAVAIAGEAGLFGPFGGTIDEPGDFLMLSILSFAMGLQNATVATSTNMAVRTTHMTGPATDFGVHLATFLLVRGQERHAAGQGALLRGLKMAAFVVGGALMLPATRQLGFLAFLVPAFSVTIATALSFVRFPENTLAAQPLNTALRRAA